MELVTGPLTPGGFGAGIPQQHPFAAGPSLSQGKALPTPFSSGGSVEDGVF